MSALRDLDNMSKKYYYLTSMKIGSFTTPNDKGQIVIPKEMRDALSIDTNATLNIILAGKGIYISS